MNPFHFDLDPRIRFVNKGSESEGGGGEYDFWENIYPCIYLQGSIWIPDIYTVDIFHSQLKKSINIWTNTFFYNNSM